MLLVLRSYLTCPRKWRAEIWALGCSRGGNPGRNPTTQGLHSGCVWGWGVMCGGRAHMSSGRKRGGGPEGLWVSTTHLRPMEGAPQNGSKPQPEPGCDSPKTQSNLTGGSWLSVQFSLSRVWLFATPWTVAAPVSITNSWSLLKFMFIELVMPSNHLILCHPLLLPPSIFPSIRVFPVIQFFASGGQNTGVSASASVFPMNIRMDFFYDWLVWSLCSPRNAQESSPTPQFKNINSSVLSFPYSPTLTFIHDYWKSHSFILALGGLISNRTDNEIFCKGSDSKYFLLWRCKVFGTAPHLQLKAAMELM